MVRNIPQKYLVAFSFAGEERELVRPVAGAVKSLLGEGKVFFDEWFEDKIAGFNSDLTLQKIYGEESTLVVMCISENYNKKHWTKSVEYAAIRDLQYQTGSRVLPLRVGDGNLDGMKASAAICPDIRKKSPQDIAELIGKRLREIIPKTIYLAECTADMEAKRKRIKQLLNYLGWTVLPNSEYPDDEGKDKYLNRLREDMKNSDAFIQIIGEFPWKFGGFDRIQYEMAVAKDLPLFRYRSSEIDLNSVDNAQHLEFLSEANVIASGFEDFKSHLEAELKILDEKLKQDKIPIRRNGTQPLVRVVIRSPDPEPLWDQVFEWANKEGVIVAQIFNDESFEVKHLAEPCQGFLVVCDTAALEMGPHSPRTDMEQCRNIQLKSKGTATPPPVGLIYFPPPDVKWARLLRTQPLNLHTILRNEPEKLHKFFDAVREVAQ